MTLRVTVAVLALLLTVEGSAEESASSKPFRVTGTALPEKGGLGATVNMVGEVANLRCQLLGRSVEVIELTSQDHSPEASVSVLDFRCVKDLSDRQAIEKAVDSARRLVAAMQAFSAEDVVAMTNPNRSWGK